MKAYGRDRSWSDLYIPAFKQTVGPHLLEGAPLLLDQKQETDLIILGAKDKRIACRVRRPGYLGSFGWQFTIRSFRESGALTELQKILEGFGDWMCYAHAAEDESARTFARWMILDLDVFRRALSDFGHEPSQDDPLVRGWQENYDYETRFAWYDVRSFMATEYETVLVAYSEKMQPIREEVREYAEVFRKAQDTRQLKEGIDYVRQFIPALEGRKLFQAERDYLNEAYKQRHEQLHR